MNDFWSTMPTTQASAMIHFMISIVLIDCDPKRIPPEYF
jgi:hypothetical protein